MGYGKSKANVYSDHRQKGVADQMVIAKEERLKQSSTLRDNSMMEDCFGRHLQYHHSLAMTFLFSFSQTNLGLFP